MATSGSLNEWVVLALLVEEPAHGFAIAKELRPESDLGRILTVRRPLVYRALDRIVDAGYAQTHQQEPGDAGPTRTLFRPTAEGEQVLDQWLITPVDHVRDLRVEFLIKLRLTERRGVDPFELVSAQRSQLADALNGLTERDSTGDVVDRWRHHNANAALAFLSGLDG